MRFRNATLALVASALLAAAVARAAPVDSRNEVVARMKSAFPTLSITDLASGSAAFDEERRAAVETHSGAAAPVLAQGRKLWERKFKDGRSLEGCFPNGGRRVSVTYPQFDTRVKRVVTLEMAINQCLKAHGEALYEPADPATMGAAVAYARSLSATRKVAVRVPPAAEAALEEGRRLHTTRMGQRNYACASCHVVGAGRRYGDEALSSALGQVTSFPVIRNGSAVTLHARMRECLELMGAAPFAAGSDELNNLEYYLTYLANGLPLKPNAWRP